ncbi:hypothetical protein H4582DRAFT_1977630, partial [Lactarius indigo]
MTRARTRVQFFSLIWRVRKFAAMSTCSLGGIAHSEVIVLLHYGSLLQYTLIAYRYQCLCDITIGCTVLLITGPNHQYANLSSRTTSMNSDRQNWNIC